MKRIYPQTDVRTGRTTYALWEGTPSKSNRQRLLRPRLVQTYETKDKALRAL